MYRSAQNFQLKPDSCLADAGPALERFLVAVTAKLGLSVNPMSVAPNSTPATPDRAEIKRLCFVFEYTGEQQQGPVATDSILGAILKLSDGKPLAALEPLLAGIADTFTRKPEAKLEDLLLLMAPPTMQAVESWGVDLAAGPDQTATATVDTSTGKIVSVDVTTKRAKKSQDPQ